jgi:hypothetical protein
VCGAGIGVPVTYGLKTGLFAVVRIVPDKTDYEKGRASNQTHDIFVRFSTVSWNKWNFLASYLEDNQGRTTSPWDDVMVVLTL